MASANTWLIAGMCAFAVCILAHPSAAADGAADPNSAPAQNAEPAPAGTAQPPQARAADQAAQAPAGASNPEGDDSGQKSATPANLKLKTSRRRNEKDTEGTEAYDRFQADIVIKSKYQLNGKQLEVDPD